MHFEKNTVQKIEDLLREHFHPDFLRVEDDSARHAGHRGAKSGKGHYRIEVVSALFVGKTLIEQHRMVNGTLKELLETEIHALQLKTRPSQP